MNLRQLQYFLEIAELRSFTRAADCVEESAPMYKKVGLRRAQRKLIVARELVTRCFAEQLRDCDLMTNPELVRTYLTAQFAPLEREVFACLYLDLCAADTYV